MMLWSRISMANETELSHASLRSLQDPSSLRLEADIRMSLLQSMDKIHSAFEHSIDEDEYSLSYAKHLTSRKKLAVQSRLYSKKILDKNMVLVENAYQAFERKVNEAELSKSDSSPEQKKKKKKKKTAT